MQELQRQAGWGRTFGLPLEILSTDEAHDRFPLFDPAGVLGAAFLPTDGYLDPSGLTFALAEGAKQRGAEIRTSTRVTAIDVARRPGPGRRDRAARADRGRRRRERRWDVREPARTDGRRRDSGRAVRPPVPADGADRGRGARICPTIRDPDRLVYFRPEAGGGLVMGGYERNPDPWAVEDGPPADFNRKLLPEDWPRFEALADAASSLVPALGDAGVVRLIERPGGVHARRRVHPRRVRRRRASSWRRGSARTGSPGPAASARSSPSGSSRASRSGTSGRWTSAGSAPTTGRGATRGDRAYEVYATYYDIHYPGEERQAGRPLKLPPAYARLEALDAEFGEKSGWERVNWFRSNEDPEHEGRRPRGWAGEHWSTAIVTEHLACRERAALFDESSFAKLEVSGDDALAFLQRICSRTTSTASRAASSTRRC